jgi:hypothetical protein
MIMFAHDRRKVYGVLFALTMQFSLLGMTKEQALGLTMVAGAVPAAFVSQHTDDPKVIATAFLLPAALVYQCAKRYTPGYVFSQVRNIVEGPVSKDPLASSYQESFKLEEDDGAFIKKVSESKSYQENISQEVYPVIIARNKLQKHQESLSKAEELLLYIKSTAHKNIDFEKMWFNFDDKRDKYSKNIEMATGRIVMLPGYGAMDMAYTKSQNARKQLEINQQNADINKQNADIAEKTVGIKQQNADTASSYVGWKWLKLLFALFGYKTK